MKEVIKKKDRSTLRHTTKRKTKNPTPIHSSISCGKKERELLSHLNSLKDERFNLKAYHRISGTPRSTIYDMLDRLIRMGLVIKPNFGFFKISSKGNSYVEVSKGVSEPLRRECRDGSNSNLSTHYLKYKMKIVDRSKFTKSNLKKLNALDTGENKLHNLHQHFVYFHDATIIINPKVVILRIHDIITEDTDESQVQSLSLAIDYVKKLSGIGVQVDEMMLEDGHFARVNSLLSDFIEKIDNRYMLDLGNGKKLWIDHSNEKREDETNDLNVRQRLDEFLDDAINSESLVSEIGEMKEVVGTLVKIRVLDMKIKNSQSPTMEVKDDKPLANYFNSYPEQNRFIVEKKPGDSRKPKTSI